MTNYQNIVFGVDLVKAAQDEYDFLLKVDGLEYLRNDAVLQYAIHRYENLWLPLVASQNDEYILPECLEPPVDIAWVWHCHMLSPHNYASYCKSLFGKVLDHSVSKSKAAYDLTKSTWARHYPNEPFELSQDIVYGNCPTVPPYPSKSDSFDLLAAIHRQQDFVYNIHLPHYRNMMFLEAGLTRYKQYLFLKKKHPTVFLVPCYDIDLIWHTHQLHPIDYERVTKSLLGWLLIHDDTDSDRNPGSKLSNAYEETRKLWQEEYNESFIKSGAMYRGDSPKGRLYLLTKQDIEGFSGRKAEAVIENISISLPNPVGNKNIKLKILKNNWSNGLQRIQKLTGKMGNMTWNNLSNVQFSYGPSDATLVFELATRHNFFGGGSKAIGGFQERFGFYLQNPERSNGGYFKFEREMQMLSTASAAKCIVDGRFGCPSLADIVLLLEPGTYEEANMPTNVDQLWGPVPLPKSDAENICQVASHRLQNPNGNIVFTCRIIHSVKTMTSVVHVFFHDKLAAVAHVIGTDQLPIETQTSENISLNPGAGERAVLIKTGEGDSMILIGKWTGFVRGVAGTRGKQGIPGNPGHLEVRVYRIDAKSAPTGEKIYLSQYQPLEYEGLTLDLNRGTITCSGLKSDKILEYVTLSFSVALLHVLCVPRPTKWKPGESLKPKLAKRGRRRVERFPDEDMSFMMAAGLLYLTPSNHYIYHNYGANVSAGCASGGIVSDSCGKIGRAHV